MGQQVWRCVNQPQHRGYWQILGLQNGDADADTAPRGFQVTQLPNRNKDADSDRLHHGWFGCNILSGFFSMSSQNTTVIKMQIQVSQSGVRSFTSAGLLESTVFYTNNRSFTGSFYLVSCVKIRHKFVCENFHYESSHLSCEFLHNTHKYKKKTIKDQGVFVKKNEDSIKLKASVIHLHVHEYLLK